ncbi:hypothetical protein BDM02DRAFT_3123722 [Thelephora ganbajun]|uniref:Uncharacterized protein n=1 Tax=Thelephora ganbajun TaxID=370292 RepID=A0ACB6Z0X2_THEGA|nr:hypothetical protein BDM02DRAFT_3123722 [Thelephora ganbajun]
MSRALSNTLLGFWGHPKVWFRHLSCSSSVFVLCTVNVYPHQDRTNSFQFILRVPARVSGVEELPLTLSAVPDVTEAEQLITRPSVSETAVLARP